MQILSLGSADAVLADRYPAIAHHFRYERTNQTLYDDGKEFFSAEFTDFFSVCWRKVLLFLPGVFALNKLCVLFGLN